MRRSTRSLPLWSGMWRCGAMTERPVTTSTSAGREVSGKHRGEAKPAQPRHLHEERQERGQARARHQVPAVVTEVHAGQRHLAVPRLDERRTCSSTTLGSWLRLPPRAAGTMQNAQRCWQPSWTLTKARERPVTRAKGAKGKARAPADVGHLNGGRRAPRPVREEMLAPARAGGTSPGCPAPDPPRRAAPPRRDRSGPSSPSPPRRASGSSRRTRLMSWRSDTSARPVTVHVLTT